MPVNDPLHPVLHPAFICAIKALPKDQLVAAAARAIEINPRNAPPAHLLALGAEQGVVLPVEHLAVVTKKRWKESGVYLTVGFMDNPPSDLRARILSHMNSWGLYANVQFAESLVSPQVRISRTDGGGYWSYLGTDIEQRPADQATMNLDSFTMATEDSYFYKVIRHETGHTLGFPHEHTRSGIVANIDPAKAIAYFGGPPNNWSAAKVTEQVLTPLDNSALIATANADPNSIMCYSLPAEIMKNGVAVAGGNNIDTQDAQFAASVYPLTPYVAVYAQGSPGNGIGGYDLKSGADRVFAFDYDHSGRQDYLALYRPGTGTMWILKNTGGNFAPVYHQGSPGSGIGGYDLKGANDQAFAFDYDHSGKLDHIVLYRPGTGTIWILKNAGGTFTPVYAQGAPGNGIGGFDLKSGADRVFAFDYDHSGKLDHLVLYRPGTGTLWILKNVGGNFTSVYAQGAPGNGIGGYDLKGANDQVLAFDYDHSGKQDHLVLYRPGTGTIWILKNTGGTFTPVYHQGAPGNGIGGYDLSSSADRVFAFDYEQSGKLDYLGLYRPGTGTFWILKNTGGSFAPLFHTGAPGIGVGIYDLKSPADQILGFDYDHTGKLDHLTLYRPGTGTCWILKKR